MRGWLSSRGDVRRLSRRMDMVETASFDHDQVTDVLAARQAKVEQREAAARAELAAVEQQAADLRTLAASYADAITASRQDRAALWEAVRALQPSADHQHPTYATALDALSARCFADEAALATVGDRVTAAATAAQAATAAASTAKTTAQQAKTTADAAAAATNTEASRATAAEQALTARVTALESRTVQVRRTSAALPLIALGAVYDQTITWTTPLPSPAYAVEWVPGPALLGKATLAIKPGSQTAAGLTVRVTATALVALGATVDATATWQG